MDPLLIHPNTSAAQSPSSPEQDPSAHEQALAGGVDPSDVSGVASHAEPKAKAKPRKSERDMGKTLLPVARVQKILKADKEMSTCGKDAVFLISVAAEEFIKRLAQAGHQQAQRDKRSTVQQRDLATAVRTTQHEELAFLEDIIPPAMTLSRALELASQFDPNDLFAEPPSTTQSRLVEERRRETGRRFEEEERGKAEREEERDTDRLNGKGNGHEEEKGKGKERVKEKKGTEIHVNGVQSGKSRSSDASIEPPSHQPVNGSTRRDSSPRATSRSYTHHHHAPFNPPLQHHHHEPRSHTHSHSHSHPLPQTHHHHHHVHSPGQTHDFPPPPRLSPVTNGAPFGYPHAGSSHHYSAPSPELNHGSEPRHSPREPRYSPHSPRDPYFPPPPPDIAYHHHPLPPLPAHYHDFPPPTHYDPRGPPQSYGPYWHGPGREPYERLEYADSREPREHRDRHDQVYDDRRDARYSSGSARPHLDHDPHDPRGDRYSRLEERR
ncbi:hypothetical protein CALVIDRAFT_133077 [Calocera viscosa TUFC12733]|uniref:Transcription factor CBF/NF-Y/archaeal histone domain-containing protein n=1 Tax=Calocera viscosa (strain TUFC12733) TaxID=1330018 RepID=A0A167RWA7_CALVF|nr:hypothetical protein CALVIDRAFT_133077 [Calocera viscosa TUFC12733]